MGTTVIPVASGVGFAVGQTITIGQETAVVAATTGGGRGGNATISVTAPLKAGYPAGVQVSGSGITFSTALTKAHASGAQVASDPPTPGAPNKYYQRGR